MSVASIQKRLSRARSPCNEGPGKVVMLTAYTKPMAQLLDPHCDILLLVGDSLGMIIYGLDNTMNVSLDTMIATRKRSCAARTAPW